MRETCDFFGKFSKVDLFDLKPNCVHPLPGKYRNGVVVAVCNLVGFP